MPDQASVIVVAESARALAASARRAGYAPLAIDVFGDSDTRALSEALICLDGGLAHGLNEAALMRAINLMLADYNPIGVICSGLDDQPDSIAAMERRARVIGNRASTIARVKDPSAFAGLCADCGVPHPEIALRAPTVLTGWLVKQRGGSGGGHIRAATSDDCGAPGNYFQRRVEGESCSALFAADGENAQIIGLSSQWSAPTPLKPFRFGGAVGPISLPAGQIAAIARAVGCLTPVLGLVGLNSADFLIDGDDVWLLEINPRPGATLDVFDSTSDSLMKRHIAACEGNLAPLSRPGQIKAAAIVYAPSDLFIPAPIDWPDWAADRSMPGTQILAGEPFCTVLATGPTPNLAQSCARERARHIVAGVGGVAR